MSRTYVRKAKLNIWAECISQLTCINKTVVSKWMQENGLDDLADIQKHLGMNVYPGPKMVKPLTKAILGW